MKIALADARIFLIASLFLLFSNYAYAAPVEEWSRIYGGDFWDAANSVAEIPDEGYIITGSRYIQTTSANITDSNDAILIKTDLNGNEQWNRVYAGKRGMKVSIARDGGYIIRGLNDWDFWLMKTDAIGREQWNRIFGGSYEDFVSSVQQTSDGGYVFTGYTNRAGDLDAWVIKTDAKGKKKWKKAYERSKMDNIYTIKEVSNHVYLLAGYSESDVAGSKQAWMVKIRETGAGDDTTGERSVPGFEIALAAVSAAIAVHLRRRVI